MQSIRNLMSTSMKIPPLTTRELLIVPQLNLKKETGNESIEDHRRSHPLDVIKRSIVGSHTGTCLSRLK